MFQTESALAQRAVEVRMLVVGRTRAVSVAHFVLLRSAAVRDAVYKMMLQE